MTEPQTLGAYLRYARRKRRISIERAADDTRIRADFLMRMESDEFDFLAPAYVRSFLKNYSRFLRLDTDPILREFDRRYGNAKFETQQIAALERRARTVPRERKLNSWGIAAAVASVLLLGLTFIGLATGPDGDEAKGRQVASAGDSPEPTESAEEEATSPTPEPEDSFIALTEGIELEVVAATADCWLEVYADGEQLFYTTLAAGERQTFEANNKMFVRLGYPAGVKLIVNGKDLGTPGGEEPIELVLPDDVESAF